MNNPMIKQSLKMLNSLNAGVSGLQQFQNQIDMIGNNIANVNTTGFKSARVNFADTFVEAMSGPGKQMLDLAMAAA